MFSNLLTLVNEYLCGNCYLEEEEVLSRIEEAFDEDKLTGTQYDHLIDLMN